MAASSSNRRPWHRRRFARPAAAAVVALVIGAATLAGLPSGVFAGYEGPSQDALFPRGPTDPGIVVVGIDARSIRELGEPWPWPRDLHARLVRRLEAEGVAAVGYDVVFDLPRSGDDELAAAMAETGSTVLVAGGRDEPGARSGAGQQLATPLPELTAAAAGVGHGVTEPGQSDGVVRRLPLVLTAPDGAFVPALSLATVTLAGGHDPDVVTVRPSGVQIGDRLYPTEDGVKLRISFAEGLQAPDASAGQYVSAVDVIRGTTTRDLTGAIVFVGATDPLLGDTALTPVRKAAPGGTGVYVHANAANTMSTGRFLAPVGTTATVVAVLVIAFLVALGVIVWPWWSAPFVAVGVGGAFLVFVSWRFDAGESWSLVYPALAVVLAAAAGLAVRYLTETRERRLVAELFSPYVPAAVADLLLQEGRVRSAARGDRLEVSVLFCDIRGFTALAAQRPASDVGAMLASYYEVATRVVLAHGGTLMQYVGDEVFAVFGAPMPQDDHADRAMACAIALQGARGELAGSLEQLGLPALEYGIGIHAGEVVAAHIGGALRRQYSVVGTTVNVGSRICSLAGPGEITCTRSILERTSTAPVVEALGPVDLKGVAADPQVARLVPDLPTVSAD